MVVKLREEGNELATTVIPSFSRCRFERRLNAMGPAMVEEIASVLNQAQEKRVNAIIITGTGRAFSAGEDIKYMEKGLGANAAKDYTITDRRTTSRRPVMKENKVIIVEGRTDKERLLKILAEPVDIICTNGTLGEQKIEELILLLQHNEVYVLADADAAGNKLRQRLKQELPNARHLYTRMLYREVASTPLEYLTKLLMDAHFLVNEDYI